MNVVSSAFQTEETIPEKYTCGDRDVSPPLKFENVPEEAAELVLVVDDPDAPDGTFTHWMVWNLDPKREEIQEGTTGNLGALEGHVIEETMIPGKYAR